MEETDHHLIVGKGAQEFARGMGFKIEDDLNTDRSRKAWLEWKRRTDPLHYLDPIKRQAAMRQVDLDMMREGWVDPNHFYGTINCDGVNAKGEVCGVTTTSGLAWKIPGRVGDSPILGAGLYVFAIYSIIYALRAGPDAAGGQALQLGIGRRAEAGEADLDEAQLTVAVGDVLRGPVLVGELVPDGHVVVERDRPVDAELLDGAAHVVVVLLEVELRGVDADDDEAVVLVAVLDRQGVSLVERELPLAGGGGRGGGDSHDSEGGSGTSRSRAPERAKSAAGAAGEDFEDFPGALNDEDDDLPF